MQKSAFLVFIGFLFLASHPSFAQGIARGPGGATVPPVNQVQIKPVAPTAIQPSTGAVNPTEATRATQRLYLEGQSPETAQQLRQQVETQQEIKLENMRDAVNARQEQMQVNAQEKQMALEQKLEQRREEIRQRLASKSAQMSQKASEHMSVVAQRVQALHDLAEKQKAIGPEIREIAQAQQDKQASTAAQLNKIENRNRILQFLVGQDGQVLEQLNVLQTENEEHIVQLQTVLDSTTDEEARIVIENTIDSLEEQNIIIEQQVEKEGQTFSLFGWVRQVFRR